MPWFMYGLNPYLPARTYQRVPAEHGDVALANSRPAALNKNHQYDNKEYAGN